MYTGFGGRNAVLPISIESLLASKYEIGLRARIILFRYISN
jgi:hypothetical protein